jgi:radical SAM protein with 4Fe4S-binding SPASM domain
MEVNSLNKKELHPEGVFEKIYTDLEDDFKIYQGNGRFSLDYDKVEEVNCSLCGEPPPFESVPIFNKFNFPYFSCPKCTLIYPSPRPKEHYINEQYKSGRFSKFFHKVYLPSADYRMKTIFLERVENIIKPRVPSGKILDIGCSSGHFLKVADNHGYDVFGIEPNPEMVLFAKQILGLQNIKNGMFTDGMYPSNYFDVITLWDVLEHVVDPNKLLQAAKNILKPGGWIFAYTENIDSFNVFISKSDSEMIAADVHIRHYSPKTFKIEFEKAGFAVREVMTHGLDIQHLKTTMTVNPDKYPSELNYLLSNENKFQSVINACDKGDNLRLFAQKKQSITTADLEDRYSDTSLAFEEELLRLHGSRYSEYRKNYKLSSSHKLDLEFPIYLMLEQSFKCNLSCPSCIQGYPDDMKKFSTGKNIMERSLFEKIVIQGEENNCPSIAFHVNDEPLIVKDIHERIAFARDHGFIDLILTTNATLFTYDKIKAVVDAGITQILFSVDAATPETYKTVRPGGNFNTVVKNIKLLLDYKKDNNLILPTTRASFVSSKLNYHEKDLFIEYFSKIVDFIEVQTLSTYYDNNKDLVAPGAVKINDFRCSEPWVRLIIRPNGDVLPCCSFYGYEIILGNINDLSLKEIYNGEKCRKLKNEIKDGNYSLSACQTCSKSLYKMKNEATSS